MISVDLSKKILNVGPEYLPPKGGIAQVIFNYSNYVFPKNEFRYLSNSCDGNRIKKIYKLITSLIGYFATLIFQRKIKIVHIHTASNFSFKRSSWFVRLAKLFKKKIILHVHGGGFKDYYYANNNADFVRKTLCKCDLIVVLTDAWADWFRTEVGIDNLKVLPNLIPEPAPCEIERNDDRFHLLFLGLINEPKGVFDLVNAIKSNNEKLEGRFKLHVGGNGQVERLKNEIAASHLEDLVKYEGWVDSSAKHKLFCTCDALILPSYIEGLPLSILEAMSYRKPVISTPVGGIPSMIDDGVNGFLIKPGDGSSFIERIIYLINHKSECRSMGDLSFERISKHFPESVSDELVDLYEGVIR
ncbi:MAG: glycosyltransferase family 4 protein [Muribaculaceae bacterium]|nr:glycosyltransferase family 4 protein [Muribaculaceae bacterium]